jgi:hypothetical protein
MTTRFFVGGAAAGALEEVEVADSGGQLVFKEARWEETPIRPVKNHP